MITFMAKGIIWIIAIALAVCVAATIASALLPVAAFVALLALGIRGFL